VSRIVAVLLVVAAALTVGASAAQAPNVTGVLVIPRAFVCPSDEVCDPPPVIATLVFSRSGSVAARVRVGGGGRFAVRLPPGRYTIRFSPPPSPWRLSPATVRVPRAAKVLLRLTLVR